jgi:hypothetical protein
MTFSLLLKSSPGLHIGREIFRRSFLMLQRFASTAISTAWATVGKWISAYLSPVQFPKTIPAMTQVQCPGTRD